MSYSALYMLYSVGACCSQARVAQLDEEKAQRAAKKKKRKAPEPLVTQHPLSPIASVLQHECFLLTNM